jgi:2-iminobutanoate/2-iminopropanoate deaminase
MTQWDRTPTPWEENAMPKHVPELPGIAPSKLPFSQVVEANGLVFVAGQVGDAPGTEGPVPGGVEAQTRAMLENVGRLLRAANLDYPDVVKATVYLRDFDEFAAYNRVYREFFPEQPPTRATVGVSRLVGDYAIEIEVIAAR